MGGCLGGEVDGLRLGMEGSRIKVGKRRDAAFGNHGWDDVDEG